MLCTNSAGRAVDRDNNEIKRGGNVQDKDHTGYFVSPGLRPASWLGAEYGAFKQS